MIKRIMAGTALALGLLAGNAQAVVTNVGITALDSETGLQWLELSRTAGLSIDQVLAGAGGWIANYRYATQNEVLTLLDHLNFIKSDFTTANIGAGEFVFKIGGSTPLGYAGTWFSVGSGDGGADGMAPDIYVHSILASGDGAYNPNTPACPKYFDCARNAIVLGAQSSSLAASNRGSFLVANVPEPATLALLGLGLLGFAAHRRHA